MSHGSEHRDWRLIAAAQRDAQRRLAEESDRLARDLASRVDIDGVVRRHPLAAGAIAIVAGFCAAKAARRWWRDRADRDPTASEAPAMIPGHDVPPSGHGGFLTRLFTRIVVPMLVDRALASIRASDAPTADPPPSAGSPRRGDDA